MMRLPSKSIMVPLASRKRDKTEDTTAYSAVARKRS